MIVPFFDFPVEACIFGFIWRPPRCFPVQARRLFAYDEKAKFVPRHHWVDLCEDYFLIWQVLEYLRNFILKKLSKWIFWTFLKTKISIFFFLQVWTSTQHFVLSFDLAEPCNLSFHFPKDHLTNDYEKKPKCDWSSPYHGAETEKIVGKSWTNCQIHYNLQSDSRLLNEIWKSK